MHFFETTLFILALFSGSVILILGLCTAFIKGFNFWPPPKLNSWQKRVSWFLFRFLSYPLFTIVILNLKTIDWNNTFSLLGGLTFGFCLLLAFRISIKLGIKNTYGDRQGLITDGWYSISRNPVYLVTIIALLGLIICMPIFEVVTVSLLWILIYILIPFVEEPWLEKQYGKKYLEYKKRVGRFM